MKNSYPLIALLLMMLMACQEKEREQSAIELSFNETFRPQFHFSPPSQWMNDPNGMVY